MRWDIRLEGDTTRIGRGAAIELDGVEMRRVVAFDTDEGWVLARSMDGQCGCGAPPGIVHSKPRPAWSEDRRAFVIKGSPCLTLYRGRVVFREGAGARPTAPVLWRKAVTA